MGKGSRPISMLASPRLSEWAWSISMSSRTAMAGASASPMPVLPCSSATRTTTVSAMVSRSESAAATVLGVRSGMTSTVAMGDVVMARVVACIGLGEEDRQDR